MHPILLYLLKMMLCSGVLYGYYRLALYNEKFHRWNRFYLMAALLLSIVVPIIEIPVAAEAQPAGVLFIIETVPAIIATKAANWFTLHNIMLGGWILTSLVLAGRMLAGLYHTIYLPYKQGEISRNEDFSVVLTEEQAAPYSFFSWLFWRHDMSPDSREGRHVLAHELAHIRQRHSADKLFCEAILLVFWCNPFFWLIRREMYMIHEFLADRQAIQNNDGAAFAAMILQTLPLAQPGPLANPFFSSQIKRRLRMITHSKKPQFSYLRRISGLAALVLVSFVLMLTVEKGMAQKTPPPPPPPPVAPPPPPALPDSIVSLKLTKKNNTTVVEYQMKDGSKKVFPPEEAMRKGYPVPPPPPPAPPAPGQQIKEVPVSGVTITRALEIAGEPLYVYAGLVISKEQMQMIPPDNIQNITVLKGEKAAEAYGEKGKNGVVLITPKNVDLSQKPVANNVPREVVVHGYAAKPKGEVKLNGENLPDNVIYVIDGKVTIKDEVNRIKPDAIGSINILKGNAAVEKYGAKAAEGVIEISTRETHVKVFTKAEQMPSFPGGQEEWLKYLQKNIRYPDAAIDKGIQGVVLVQFIVHEDGFLSDVELLTDPGEGLGEEAMRLIKRGPKWVPAQQNGKTVTARAQQVVTFRLE